MNAQGTPETWLVAHDFSPCSDAAAIEAARLLGPSGGKVTLFHVHEPVRLSSELAWGEATNTLERAVRERLAVVAAALRAQHPLLQVEVVVTSGEPVRAILDEAARSRVDHIVVGSHGRTGVARAVLGSVAERVVHGATMPVLVVKHLDTMDSQRATA